MPRKKGSDAEEDEDYDPYESFDDDRRVRQRTSSGQEYNKSSRGRPVRVCFPVPVHTSSLESAICWRLSFAACMQECSPVPNALNRLRGVGTAQSQGLLT